VGEGEFRSAPLRRARMSEPAPTYRRAATGIRWRQLPKKGSDPLLYSDDDFAEVLR
jgi:hypothetical protein